MRTTLAQELQEETSPQGMSHRMLLLALNSTAATPQYVSVSAFDCYFPATDFEYHITAAIGVTLADPDNQDVCKAVSGQRSGGMIGPMNTEAYRA
ncbi:MAG: hypothetical protein Q9194_002418 [Teloschistes cf. exilis]